MAPGFRTGTGKHHWRTSSVGRRCNIDSRATIPSDGVVRRSGHSDGVRQSLGVLFVKRARAQLGQMNTRVTFCVTRANALSLVSHREVIAIRKGLKQPHKHDGTLAKNRAEMNFLLFVPSPVQHGFLDEESFGSVPAGHLNAIAI